MKWLPRSISGQLLTLWLIAFLAAHVIAILMLSAWRAENTTIHPMSARTIETRVVSAYRALALVPDAEQLLKDVSLPDSRFKIVKHPMENPPGSSKQEQEIEDALRHMLSLPVQTPIDVRIHQIPAADGKPDNRNWLEKAFQSNDPWALDIEVALPDGAWLHSEHWPAIMPAHWTRVLTFSALVCLFPSTLIAVLFGRRIMRPLRELADASRKLSRGEYVALSQHNGSDGVREIIQAFNDMQTSLIRFVKGRTQMIASIGHDLRTPLTSLRIRAEMIDDEKLREGIVRTLDDMTVIIEGTLQFAKDDALQEPTQDVQINTLINDLIHDQAIQGKTVSLISQADPELFYRCRPVHLKRAIANLVDNAVRYGPVNIRIIPLPEDDVLRIKVEDNGPGIPEDQLEQVFEPFVRLDTARNLESSNRIGLGLSIARSCVRAHGGEITLQNRVEGGLCAVIDLPL